MLLLRPGDDSRQQVLLQLRQHTGYMDDHWAAAAAGHVERGETVFEAAAREAQEELGITVSDLAPWCTMQRTGATGDPIDERVDYFLTTTSWTGTPRIMEPGKCAGLDWFDLERLPEPVVPHERRVLDTVRAGRTAPILVHGFEEPPG